MVKKKRDRENKPFNDDKLIRKVRDEIIQGEITEDLGLSHDELKAILDKTYQNGEISKDTYQFIHDKNLIKGSK